VFVVNAYVPNSGEGLKRLDYRINSWVRLVLGVGSVGRSVGWLVDWSVDGLRCAALLWVGARSSLHVTNQATKHLSTPDKHRQTNKPPFPPTPTPTPTPGCSILSLRQGPGGAREAGGELI